MKNSFEQFELLLVLNFLIKLSLLELLEEGW